MFAQHRRLTLSGILALVASGVAAPAGAGLERPGPVSSPPSALVRTYALAGGDEAPVVQVSTKGCINIGLTTEGTGADTKVTIDGFPYPFTLGAIPTTWWAKPPLTSATFSLQYNGLMWLGPVASKAAAANDQDTITALVTAVTRLFAANPDTGKSVNGWDEGSNLRRQQALNCLWRVSGGNPALVPAIEATSAANLDERRYYGPPFHPIHNHGLMANLALLDAGELRANPKWTATAINRMVRDSSGAWTQSGLAHEQSGSYGIFNVSLWRSGAAALASYPGTASAVARIQADLTRAEGAYAHLTDPAGGVVLYGDGGPRPGVTQAQASATLRDDSAGVATGRWSWSDPTTSYYLLRYGGPRRMHGHEDRGSLVWSTQGLPILVDSQTFSSDLNVSHSSWCRSAMAHNTQIPVGRALNPSAGVTLAKTTRSGPVHAYTLTDRQYGQAHTRQWLIDDAHHRVEVRDTTPSAATTMLHFAARWTLKSISADGHRAVLASGLHRLSVVSSGRITAYRGSLRPMGGWIYTVPFHRDQAVQLAIATPAGTSTTRVTVTPPSGSQWSTPVSREPSSAS